jgi:hypothetical protein
MKGKREGRMGMKGEELGWGRRAKKLRIKIRVCPHGNIPF